MKRLYFRVPTVENATSIVKELVANGVPEDRIYLVGKDHYHLYMAHLKEAGILQTTDLPHALIRGAVIGALAGLVAGLVVLVYPPGELDIGWWILIALAFLGAMFGAWGSSLIGISIPNPIIQQCAQAIELGELVIIFDIPVAREKEITLLIKNHHPEVLIESLAIKK